MWRIGSKLIATLCFLLGSILLSTNVVSAQELCLQLTERDVSTSNFIGVDYNNRPQFETVFGSETDLDLVPCSEDEPDEVLGETITATELAYTGSSVATPTAIGMGLLGTGGLALYAAKRRQEAHEAQ